MITVAPHPAMASERPVHRPRHPDREAAYAALEGRRLVRFHQQVQMIGLDAELKDPKARVAGPAERRENAFEEAFAPEGRYARSRAERDMGGTVSIVGNASPMWHRAASGSRLSTGSLTAAAPRVDRKVELSVNTHLNWAYIITN